MGLFTITGFAKHIRKTTAGIELATVRMGNHRGRSVTLVGVQHIATQDSWDRDIAKLRELEAGGAKIFLEGVLPVEGEVSEDEQVRVAALKELMKTQAVMAKATGLIHQKTAFTEAATTWAPYDLSILEVAKELKPSTIRRLQKMAKVDHDFMESEPEMALTLLRLLPFIPTSLSRVLSGDLSKQIIDRRNEYAVEGVLRSSVDHRVLFWGAAHLSGMVKLLKEQGYSVIAEDWRVVLPASHNVPDDETS